MTKRISAASAFLALMASPALAHHPLGGEVPQTVVNGVLSGIGHPIIGFDHLAFVLGIGLLAAFQKSRFVLPAGFVAGTVLGTLMIISGVTLPAVELVITASVLMVGVLAMMGRALPAAGAGVVAAGAGLFHGWAYGEAVIGAEPTPLIAYMAGFGVTQMAIAVGAMFAAQWVMTPRGDDAVMANLKPRLAGAMVAGVGLTYLVEIAEAAIFPAM
ncbi:MAG: HupE/UreJ family protein [Alphaproteobacteria bacterium]|nr:HupE/UreJ family protein [Alphaproteobacteria bacterium]